MHSTSTLLRQTGDSAQAAQARGAALMQLAGVLKAEGYRFTTVTPATHARVNGRRDNEWAVDLQGIFGWSRPFRPSLIPPELLALMHEAGVTAPYEDGWRSLVRASTLDDELFFHSAYPTIEADAVFFGPDTYRFVTAIDHYLAVNSAPVHRAVDIGCGAAPGAIALAKRNPDADIFALDINEAALRLAAINAALAGVGKLICRKSNLLNDIAGSFDLIIANPPYLLDPCSRAYRDGGGSLGAGLSLDIVDTALQRLNPGGSLLLYTGAAIVNGTDPFLLAVEAKLRDSRLQWQYREIDPDVFGEELLGAAYAGVDRIASVLLTATRRE